MFQTKVVYIADSSTKYFVARQQRKRNSLNFHDISEQFYILGTYARRSATKKGQLVLRFHGKNGYANVSCQIFTHMFS